MAKTRKSPIALALSDQLEGSVRAAAKAGGRTLTAEIAMRLAASFDVEPADRPDIQTGKAARGRSISALPIYEHAAAAEKLAAKVKVDGETGCHLFTGCLNYSGYGSMYVSGITFAAHRLAYELANGVISGHGGPAWVLHHCDTPACCNPEHLYLGAPADNASDMAMRARMRSGDRPQCRWQTKEDANRPTGTVFWEFQGQIRTLKEWSQLLGVNHCTLDARLMAGWPPEKISKPAEPGFKNWTKRPQAKHSYRRFSGQKAVTDYINQKTQAEALHASAA